MKKIAASVLTAVVALSLLGQPLVANAAAIAPALSASCGSLAPKTTEQTAAQYELAKKALASYCTSTGGSSTQGTNFGAYTRLQTTATLKTCTCGPSYKAWTVKASASGLPYDGRNLFDLVLLWRVGTTATWNSKTLPADTYVNMPFESGTMSTSSTIYAVTTIYRSNGTQVERVKSQAS